MQNKVTVKLDFGLGQEYTVGTLYYSKDDRTNVFQYDPKFIGTQFEISPVALPLSDDTYFAEKKDELYFLHHVFADALPDSWGRKVQEQEFKKKGIEKFTSLDRLAYVGKHGIGALKFIPAKEFINADIITNIADIKKDAQRIIEGDIDHVTDELLQIGGSAGGARPKFLVDYNPQNGQMRYTRGRHDNGYIPIVLKITTDDFKDPDRYQRIEYCYSIMAREAGITIPDTYLIKNREGLAAYGIERFDIKPSGERIHMHTLAGFLGREFTKKDISYNELMETISEYCESEKDMVEAYRRMVFNVLGVNQDDHGKNFSFIMNSKGEWSLSPAYDICYSVIKGQDAQSMDINGKTTSFTFQDLKKFAEFYEIKNYEEIIKEVINGLESWEKLAKENGVPEKKAESIRKLIEPNINRIEKEMYRTIQGKSSSPEWFKYTFKKTSKTVTVYGLKQDPENAYRIGASDGFYKAWKRDSKTGEFKEIPHLNSKDLDACKKVVEDYFNHQEKPKKL